jgi:predicted tellurium resistance membrane protein TerC
MEILFQPETYIALATLTFLEIVLGIDNIIFVSIVTNKLRPEDRPKARRWGLSLAMIFRILLLIGLTWIIRFSEPLFTVYSLEISIRDIILFTGGLFLLAKSTSEIYHKMEGVEEHHDAAKHAKALSGVIAQVILMDIIFSFDSILTAVGLTNQLPIMIAAVVIAVLVMLMASGQISNFIHKHPSLEVLALSFLILIGFMLTIEGLHQHVPKGYIYVAVFFSLSVEVVNMRVRRRGEALRLKRKNTD